MVCMMAVPRLQQGPRVSTRKSAISSTRPGMEETDSEERWLCLGLLVSGPVPALVRSSPSTAVRDARIGPRNSPSKRTGHSPSRKPPSRALAPTTPSHLPSRTAPNRPETPPSPPHTDRVPVPSDPTTIATTRKSSNDCSPDPNSPSKRSRRGPLPYHPTVAAMQGMSVSAASTGLASMRFVMHDKHAVKILGKENVRLDHIRLSSGANIKRVITPAIRLFRARLKLLER